MGNLEDVYFESAGFAFSNVFQEFDLGEQVFLDVGIAGQVEFAGNRADDGAFSLQDDGICTDPSGCFLEAALMINPTQIEDLSILGGDDLYAFIGARTAPATFDTDAQTISRIEYSIFTIAQH